jgi:hypothetical protein
MKTPEQKLKVKRQGDNAFYDFKIKSIKKTGGLSEKHDMPDFSLVNVYEK